MDTSFVGTIETGEGPTIAIMCEYDALPGIGHACGHNVIAASGAGAGAALAAVSDRLPKGRILVIGTPAEEGGGGKIRLIDGGVFAGVDAAMMVHGWDAWIGHQDLLGIVRLTFEFTGRSAHASADPWEGVNALDAVIQTFNNISMLRQQVRPTSRIHGIVTHGGAAPNIIPEFAAAMFYVRAAELDYLTALKKRVIACAEAAATATGATVKVTELEAAYEPLRRNDALLDAFRANWRALGVQESEPPKDRLRLVRRRQREPGRADDPAARQDRARGHADPLARVREGSGHADGPRGIAEGGEDHGDDRRRPDGRPGPARAREGGVPD